MRTFLFIIINFLLFLGPLFSQTNAWHIYVKGASDLSDVSLERLESEFLLVDNEGQQSSVSLASIERMSKKGTEKNYPANFLAGAIIGASCQRADTVRKL